jgi:CheY-like chemotaxis protein
MIRTSNSHYPDESERRCQPLGHAAEDITLVAVTGWGQDADKRRALAAGFDHHLTKPIDPEILGR